MRLMTRNKDRTSPDAAVHNEAVDRGAWYPDPYGEAQERWYDGTAWTQQVRGDGASRSESASGDTNEAAVATVAEPEVSPEPTAETWAPPVAVAVEPGVAAPDAIVPPPTNGGWSAPATEGLQPPPPEPMTRFEVPAVGNGSVRVGNGASSSGFGPPTESGPARLCPYCAALCHSDGLYCPHCGGPFAGAQARPGISTRVKVAAWSVAALLVLGGAGAGVAIKLHHDSQVAAQHRRAAAAAAARQQAQAQAQQAEQAQRQSLESQLESAITNDATQKANSGRAVQRARK